MQGRVAIATTSLLQRRCCLGLARASPEQVADARVAKQQAQDALEKERARLQRTQELLRQLGAALLEKARSRPSPTHRWTVGQAPRAQT